MTVSVFVRDAGGSTRYLNFRVLILARMRPRVDKMHADVHQVVLPLDPVSGRLIDGNAVVRDFPQFVQHYPGLGALLCQHVRM